MNQKTTWSVIVVIIILAIISFFVYQARSTAGPTISPTPTETDQTNSGSNGTSTASTSGVYTMAQVAERDSVRACWSVIDGNVYDLTTWIGQHPGGPEAIKSICGKDGTQAFHGQHGTEQKQADVLATFKIGTLAK